MRERRGVCPGALAVIANTLRLIVLAPTPGSVGTNMSVNSGMAKGMVKEPTPFPIRYHGGKNAFV